MIAIAPASVHRRTTIDLYLPILVRAPSTAKSAEGSLLTRNREPSSAKDDDAYHASHRQPLSKSPRKQRKPGVKASRKTHETHDLSKTESIVRASRR